jgi:hypothetical protein
LEFWNFELVLSQSPEFAFICLIASWVDRNNTNSKFQNSKITEVTIEELKGVPLGNSPLQPAATH